MKRMIGIISTTFLLVLPTLYGQGAEEPGRASGGQEQEIAAEKKFPGFVDKNDDGINDRFFDANGDGKNDLDGREYRHRFRFIDNNKDKINDLWIDRDGDGVNDLGPKFKGRELQELHRNVLDVDEDGRNDVTGEQYDRLKYHWKGEKWGFWDESRGKLRGRFIDTDGNGIDDRLEDFDGFISSYRHGPGKRDMFIDEDGDGICDERTDFLNRMGKHRQRGHRGGKGAAHGREN